MPEPLSRDETWLEGVKRRAVIGGDTGWVRVPLADWQGLVECFEMGERLYAESQARVEELERERDEAQALYQLAVGDANDETHARRDAERETERLREALTTIAGHKRPGLDGTWHFTLAALDARKALAGSRRRGEALGEKP